MDFILCSTHQSCQHRRMMAFTLSHWGKAVRRVSKPSSDDRCSEWVVRYWTASETGHSLVWSGARDGHLAGRRCRRGHPHTSRHHLLGARLEVLGPGPGLGESFACPSLSLTAPRSLLLNRLCAFLSPSPRKSTPSQTLSSCHAVQSQ